MQRSARSLLGAFLCIHCLCWASALTSSAVWDTHSTFPGARRLLSWSNTTSALMVPLAAKPGAVYRGRSMLRAATFDVGGSVRDVG